MTWIFASIRASYGGVYRRNSCFRLTVDQFLRFQANRNSDANGICTAYIRRTSSRSRFFHARHPGDFTFISEASIIGLGTCISNKIEAIRNDCDCVFNINRYETLLLCTSVRVHLYRLYRYIRADLRVFFLTFRGGFRVDDR